MRMRTILMIMIACFFWAISFIATKIATATVPPLAIVLLRLLISSLCFWLWFRFKRYQVFAVGIPGFSLFIVLFLISLFGSSLHYSVQTFGIMTTSASNASLFAVTAPLFITIISVLFLGERITPLKFTGIVLAMSGVLMVMHGDTTISTGSDGQIQGDLLVLASLLMWAIFTVMSKSVISRFGALRLTALITYIGAITMVPPAIIEASQLDFDYTTIPVQAWLAISFLGVTCSFLATLLYMAALETTESQKVGVYLYTVPIITYFFAAIFLGEHIHVFLIAGSVLVIGGVALTERS
ncbi:DMT family transporter [bacterium]|nr:DMT family transporter [bacterium]